MIKKITFLILRLIKMIEEFIIYYFIITLLKLRPKETLYISGDSLTLLSREGILKILQQSGSISIGNILLKLKTEGNDVRIELNEDKEFPKYPPFVFFWKQDLAEEKREGYPEEEALMDCFTELMNEYFETNFVSEVSVEKEEIEKFELSQWHESIDKCLHDISKRPYQLEVPHKHFKNGICWPFEFGEYWAEYAISNDQEVGHETMKNYHYLRFRKNDSVLTITIKPEKIGANERQSIFNPIVHFKVRGMKEDFFINDSETQKTILIKFQKLLIKWSEMRELKKNHSHTLRELSEKIRALIGIHARVTMKEIDQIGYVLQKLKEFCSTN